MIAAPSAHRSGCEQESAWAVFSFVEDSESWAWSLLILLNVERHSEDQKTEERVGIGRFSGLRAAWSPSTLEHMRLSEKAIQEFKEICRDEFELELSDDDAQAHALRVLELFWLLFGESTPPDSQYGLDDYVDRNSM